MSDGSGHSNTSLEWCAHLAAFFALLPRMGQTSHHRCQRQVRGPSAARQQSGRVRGSPPPLPPRCPEPGLPTGGSDAPFFILLAAFPTFAAPPTDITPTFGPVVATIAQARQATNTADKTMAT